MWEISADRVSTNCLWPSSQAISSYYISTNNTCTGALTLRRRYLQSISDVRIVLSNPDADSPQDCAKIANFSRKGKEFCHHKCAISILIAPQQAFTRSGSRWTVAKIRTTDWKTRISCWWECDAEVVCFQFPVAQRAMCPLDNSYLLVLWCLTLWHGGPWAFATQECCHWRQVASAHPVLSHLKLYIH